MPALLLPAACGGLAAAARAQATAPAPATATAPGPGRELPAAVLAALDRIEDFTVGFDWPGFYAVVEHVVRSPHSPGHTEAPREIADWRTLLEQPSAYRGCPVTLEGIVGRNKAPYELPRYPQLGELTQLELYRPDQPIACTVILTGRAADIPVRATIRVTGYFVMVRKYADRAGREQYAALVVAPAPTQISQVLRRSAGPALDWWWLGGAVALGLLATILLLRRAAAGRRSDVRRLHASRAAPLSLADDLAAWAGPDEAADDGGGSDAGADRRGQ